MALLYGRVTGYTCENTMPNLSRLKSLISKSLPFVLIGIFACSAICTMAMTSETSHFGYDYNKQLTRVEYVNHSSFSNSTSTTYYIYDNMGNRLIKSIYTSAYPSSNSPGAFNYLSPLNNSTSVNLEKVPLRWNRSLC